MSSLQKTLLIIVIILLIAGAAVYGWHRSSASSGTAATGYKDATYVLDGTPVTLKDGHAESEAAPGSASKVVTQYFGNEAEGDINGDGISDVTFILTQSTGGSGTFYYVVSALGSASGGYQGTNGILLGDRIAPQSTEYHDGDVIVNYATRSDTDPMSAAPTVGKSMTVHVVGGALVAAGT